MESDKLAFVAIFLDGLDIYSDTKNQERVSSNIEERKEAIKSLRGKYASSSISSEEFARQKQEEIDWEDRNQ